MAKVTLRQKTISGNKISLYLDFYPAITHPESGKVTRREFLKIHIFAPIKIKKKSRNGVVKEIPVYDLDPVTDAIYRNHNDENLKLAELIRQKWQNQLDKPEIYTSFEREQLRKEQLGKQNFLEYFKKLADKRSSSNQDNWLSSYRYFEKYSGGAVSFRDITKQYCEGFKDYLLSTKSIKSEKAQLSQNSAVSYFNKLKATLRQAYADGYLQIDINTQVKPIKTAETSRDFLTIEEINKLAATTCQNPVLKRAALFSCLTGLRFSDILKLTWNELENIPGEGWRINYKQKKTGNIEYLPISEQAYNLLADKTEETVFPGLKYSAYENKVLSQWVTDAGISKKVSFHVFRHSYATNQLIMGTQVATIQKLLGHKNISTTLIYAKVIDKAKREAADKANWLNNN